MSSINLSNSYYIPMCCLLLYMDCSHRVPLVPFHPTAKAILDWQTGQGITAHTGQGERSNSSARRAWTTDINIQMDATKSIIETRKEGSPALVEIWPFSPSSLNYFLDAPQNKFLCSLNLFWYLPAPSTFVNLLPKLKSVLKCAIGIFWG